MRIDSASLGDMRDVALAMRERDFEELTAVSAASTREELADLLATSFGQSGAMCARFGEEPVCIGSVAMSRPNVATLLFYATDRFPEIALGLTRWITRELFPRCKAAGVHRIECVSIEGYEETHRWIEILGLNREAVFPRFGKSGETFHQFAWVKR